MTSHLAGASAEDRVAARYERAGCVVAARRWRGRSAEIDLVLRDGDSLVFVEVKAAATHARAAERVDHIKIARLLAAAEEYAASAPEGALTPMRIDVALVDARGGIEVLEGAISA